jgi:hypothetical protein
MLVQHLQLGAFYNKKRKGLQKNSCQDFVPVVQGCLAHKKLQPPLGQLYDPRHSPAVWSFEEAVSYERGTPVRSSPIPRRARPLGCQKSGMVKTLKISGIGSVEIGGSAESASLFRAKRK